MLLLFHGRSCSIYGAYLLTVFSPIEIEVRLGWETTFVFAMKIKEGHRYISPHSHNVCPFCLCRFHFISPSRRGHISLQKLLSYFHPLSLYIYSTVCAYIGAEVCPLYRETYSHSTPSPNSTEEGTPFSVLPQIHRMRSTKCHGDESLGNDPPLLVHSVQTQVH